MPFALPKVPGLEQYQTFNPSLEEQYDGPNAAPPPAAPQPAVSAPTSRSYSPDVERWRPLVSRYFRPEDVDKALYVISGESGGDPTIRNREGSGATGLFQIMPFHGVKATDPEESVKWAAKQVSSHGWTDWGEGVTYQGKPFGILGLAPYGGSSNLDSWESPQQALAGKSSISGQPVGRAMPAISSGVDYGPATDEAISRGKLNSASRAIISNSEMQAQDTRFDQSTANPNPEQGFGWLDRPIPALEAVQNVAGEVGSRALPSFPVIGQVSQAIQAAGGPSAATLGRITGEAVVPTRPWEVALTALPAVGKVDDGAAAFRALIGMDGAVAGEALDTLPRRALNAANRRFPELPGSAPDVGRLRQVGAGGAAEDLSEWEAAIAALKKPPEVRAAEEAAFKAAESARMNADAAQSNKVYAEEGSINKRLKSRVLSVSQAMDKIKAAATDLPGGPNAVGGVFGPTRGPSSAVRTTMTALRDVSKGAQSVKPGQQMSLADPVTGAVPDMFKDTTSGAAGGFASDLLGIVGREAQGVMGAPMALRTTISPALLRQGMIRLVTNPKAALEETGLSVMNALREGDARAYNQAILDNPLISRVSSKGVVSPYKGYTFEDVGGRLRDWGADAAQEARSPDFQGLNKSVVGTVVQKIPWVRYSDRQYALQMNGHLANRYAEVAARMIKAGITDKRQFAELKDVLEHQVQMSGWKQGRIPYFFSKSALGGRIQTITDLFTHDPRKMFQPGATQEAWKGVTSMVATTMTWVHLAGELPGFDVEYQRGVMPILKTPVGRINPWAGWAGLAMLVYDNANLIQDTIEKGGSIDDVGPEATRIATDFIRGQLGPWPSKLTDIATGTDWRGETYSLSKDVKSGNFFADLGAPMIVESVLEGLTNYGAAGAAAGGIWEGLGGTLNQAKPLRDYRDEATAAGNYLDAEGKKITKFNDLLPSQQKQVNESAEVAAQLEKRPKSDYMKAKEATLAPIQAEQDKAEQAFKNGTLSQPISDWWHDLSKKREGARLALGEAFKKDLSKFEQDQFDKAVDGYYALSVTKEDGALDWDATEQKRRQFMESLSDKERVWLEDFLETGDSNQSELRREYFTYLDEREKLGYFDEDADTAALDRANPAQDVQSWYWNSGIKDQENTPSLQTAEAVNQALAMSLPNRDVKFAGLARPVNESEGTLAAWRQYGEKLSRYSSDAPIDQYKDRIAQRTYKKSYDRLTETQQSAVRSRILTALRKNDPTLDGALAWFGRYNTLQTRKAAITLREMRQRYGKEPESEDGPIRYAKGV